MENKTRSELIKICKEMDIKGFSSLKKSDLLKLITSGSRNTQYVEGPKYTTKPILKWVGGKSQILDTVMSNFPSEFNNYREIFVGGGSVLLGVLNYIKEGKIRMSGNVYAYDLNEPLIYMYKNIQSSYIELYEKIRLLIADFKQCDDDNQVIDRNPLSLLEAKKSKENYYYWIRNEYNKLQSIDKRSVNGSAMLIFLNKTCWRGVFRIGPNGFNVPYGHYKNPEIINLSHLHEIHNLIQGVIFECKDFTTSLSEIEKGDYIYLDPPYAQESSSSFVGYTLNGFDLSSHNNLFGILHLVKEKFMLSNADVTLVREQFSDQRYKISTISCRRSINSKNPEAKTNEVIITNY